jgi:hypothetical protein
MATKKTPNKTMETETFQISTRWFVPPKTRQLTETVCKFFIYGFLMTLVKKN